MTSEPWLCRLVGHDDADPYAHRNSYFVCRRCGACEMDEDFSEPWHVVAARRLRRRIADAAFRLKSWIKPCGYCGRRFGRCDEKVDHMPF